ncbi:hypothetical protein BH11BAC2_BH11BAC2_17220 [soil metagenome]
MKKVIYLLLIILSSTSAYSQVFEGSITYHTEYKSKTSEMTDEQMNKMMGSTQEYSIKGGNYKSVSNGTLVLWQLYLKKDNKLYTKMSTLETLYWNDGKKNKDEVQKVKINREVIEILGYTCDEIILICKSGIQKYYFSSKLAVDPSEFSQHLFGNWYAYLSKTSALPLKMVIESDKFILKSTATAVNPHEIEKKFFTLPADVETEESPY